MEQHYLNYNEHDQLVWRTLFERQLTNLKEKVCKEYLLCVQQLGLTAEAIPHFDDLNTRLYKATGWKIEVVEGIVPEKRFFELLAAKKFPASTWLRTMKQLDYLEEPDMFHDVFGHIPLLMNKLYANFFVEIAKIAINHCYNENLIAKLGRLYWFTIEFGLIKEGLETKIFGAGLISSFGESQHSLSKNVIHHPFHLETILKKTFINSEIQNEYFVVESWNELFTCTNAIKKSLLIREKI